ncbi:hypothetical protein G7K_5444-t1 [Saitoella complicata NRRL Y-17804]|uniref:Uncharacterized protein n=1 Tax=Saitoella complicata (strain BCRC 22490 / CBS 7301 / JCM 7358 / NBRC 10748 / NRRL Y-17804) TaxID=698492 RepID=A0A0E9NN81_SAICN|nr:hypothetical protein G7K_5444-t1 [Saitoella complicata NRRL Y-17804]
MATWTHACRKHNPNVDCLRVGGGRGVLTLTHAHLQHFTFQEFVQAGVAVAVALATQLNAKPSGVPSATAPPSTLQASPQNALKYPVTTPTSLNALGVAQASSANSIAYTTVLKLSHSPLVDAVAEHGTGGGWEGGGEGVGGDEGEEEGFEGGIGLDCGECYVGWDCGGGRGGCDFGGGKLGGGDGPVLGGRRGWGTVTWGRRARRSGRALVVGHGGLAIKKRRGYSWIYREPLGRGGRGLKLLNMMPRRWSSTRIWWRDNWRLPPQSYIDAGPPCEGLGLGLPSKRTDLQRHEWWRGDLRHARSPSRGCFKKRMNRD